VKGSIQTEHCSVDDRSKMTRSFPLLLIVVSMGCSKSAAFVGVEREDGGKSDGEKVDAQVIEVGKRRAVKGDINGDGFADFLVGAPNSSATLSQSGQAFVFLGGKNMLAQPPLIISTGAESTP
jgi:hypothetical protein